MRFVNTQPTQSSLPAFLLLISLLIALPAASQPPLDFPVEPRPVLLTIGSDAACDYDSLEFAIRDSLRFGPAQHTLRIARNYSRVVRASVVNRSLVFEGGFPTCASSQRNDRTTLRAAGDGDSIFRIQATDGGDHEVIFDFLELRGGNAPRGGALEVVGEGATARLRRTELLDNVASEKGGGVFVERGTLLLERGSVLLRNTAHVGGGISCEGSGRVELTSSLVVLNRAERDEVQFPGRGGGISSSGCTVAVNAGGAVLLNSATQGGGIHAVGGRLRVSGSNNQPASVSSNLLGGGIEGQAVNFSARNASISGNIGDGVRLFFSSYLIDRSDDCHAVDRCSRISSNTRRGITATLSQGAVLQTFVEDNGGSGVQVLSGSFTISNSVVADNNVLFDESAILVATGSANILQSTVVGADRAQPLIVAANAQVESRNSILWRRNDSGSTVFPIRGTGDIELECGIVDSISNPPSSVSGIRVFEQDPRFQSLNDDNFHLSEDSPAIDRCEVLQPRERDIDREERGFDVPGAGGFFTDDIGADEFQGIAEAEATG